METLLQLSAPWWIFVLRAGVIYLLVMLLVRASGKRAIGQMTPLDLVLLILIGNAVQNGINGGDNSITGAVIMATTLIVLNYAVAFAMSRSRRVERLVEGAPVVLARDGKVFAQVLRRELVSERDFQEALRMGNVTRLEEVGLALLETNGHITVIARRSPAAGTGEARN
ncbi:YetF domain-containing protein [Thermomonas sp.]|uniref:DUF421 domain-containing protein n=1 Tax=Thermomonas sp. TaxID=1971895 RepID=UPI001D502641|nr:YetF domain-containing protein [Thermomonas sp.]MBZ0087061.1 DUF421 domain-containing protein [Thermomonas sp.]MCO5055494.1 DUF421 domain-containing protein [Thermomonas sp.]HRO62639.1 DUF421 domain-containing protein [Thermomonas sp.]